MEKLEKKISSKKTLERRVMKMSVPRFALHLPRSSVFFSAGKLLDFVHEMDLATITCKFWDYFWGKIARWLESGLPLPSNSLHSGTLFCGTVITPCSGVLACVFSCHVRHTVAIWTTSQNPLEKKTPLAPNLLSQLLKKYGFTTIVIKDQSQTNNGTCERDIRKLLSTQGSRVTEEKGIQDKTKLTSRRRKIRRWIWGTAYAAPLYSLLWCQKSIKCVLWAMGGTVRYLAQLQTNDHRNLVTGDHSQICGCWRSVIEICIHRFKRSRRPSKRRVQSIEIWAISTGIWT